MIIFEALRNLFKKPFTVKYPVERKEVPSSFRGKHSFLEERCIGCGLCEKFCPSNCIELIEKERRIIIQLDSCMFCGLCRDVCPVDAIRFTDEFELATKDKEGLFVD